MNALHWQVKGHGERSCNVSHFSAAENLCCHCDRSQTPELTRENSFRCDLKCLYRQNTDKLPTVNLRTYGLCGPPALRLRVPCACSDQPRPEVIRAVHEGFIEGELMTQNRSCFHTP